MEREVGITVSLAVQLVALSAFLSLVFFVVFQGETIKNNTANVASEMNTEVQTGFLNQLVDHRVDPLMPTATAYNILLSYDNVITKSACAVAWDNGVAVDPIHVLMTDGSCLINHMQGEVSMELLYIDKTSEYIAFLHEADCDWLKGNCTCQHHNGTSFFKLKQQYNL